MYRCNNCGCIFEDPILVKTTYEAYYGVAGLFPTTNYMTYACCPNCKGEDYEKVEEKEEEDNK